MAIVIRMAPEDPDGDRDLYRSVPGRACYSRWGQHARIRARLQVPIYSVWKPAETTNCGTSGNAEHGVRRPSFKLPKFQRFHAFWTAKNTQKTFKKALAFHLLYVYNSKAC